MSWVVNSHHHWSPVGCIHCLPTPKPLGKVRPCHVAFVPAVIVPAEKPHLCLSSRECADIIVEGNIATESRGLINHLGGATVRFQWSTVTSLSSSISHDQLCAFISLWSID